jgi:hypothetical protein
VLVWQSPCDELACIVHTSFCMAPTRYGWAVGHATGLSSTSSSLARRYRLQ